MPSQLHATAASAAFAAVASPASTEAALDERQERLHDARWLALVDHGTLLRRPALAASFPDAVLLDPPPAAWLAPVGPRWVRVDGPAEQRFVASLPQGPSAG